MISTYSRQQVTEEDIAAVVEVLRSPRLTQGPAVERFEAVLAQYVGARHAVAVSSGTTALEMVYQACGGLSFVTSPLSFMATANAALRVNGALRVGHTVRFCDVDQATGNMLVADPSWQEWVVPVHYAGRACDLSMVNTKANEGRIIEDACHALGAMDFDGCSRVGSCAHSLATVFSFHPVKSITTGEGGAITTNDEGLAQGLRSLRDHGREDGPMVRLGLNGRMSDIQAALGLSQLKRCDEMRDRRRDLAGHYSEAFLGNGLANFDVDPKGHGAIVLPVAQGPASAWHLYPIRIRNDRRLEVAAGLKRRGIGFQIHYSPIIPLQPYYRKRYGYKPGDFPNAEAWAAEELSLPLHAGMTAADVQTVVDALREVL